jgi:hypothetical protein
MAAIYLPAAIPPMAPADTTRHWGASAADMAAITYQPAVRVALRAKDLLSSTVQSSAAPQLGGTPQPNGRGA